MQITVPGEFVPRLQLHRHQLTRILRLGLRELEAKPSSYFDGLSDVLEFLANLPTVEEVLNLRPSPQLQAQLEQLLEKQRIQDLSNENDIN